MIGLIQSIKPFTIHGGMNMWIRSIIATTLASMMFGCSGAGQQTRNNPEAVVDGRTNAMPSLSAHTSTDTSDRDISLTIYSAASPGDFDPQDAILNQEYLDVTDVPGFGVVRDSRPLKFNAGLTRVTFTDVARYIDPSSVSLVDLSVGQEAPDTDRIRVIHQKYAFDLLSSKKLLHKYIDKEISLNFVLENGQFQTVTGKLLSNDGGDIIMETADGIRILSWANDIKVGKLPGGLITKPTLQWDVKAPAEGQRQVQTSYQTSGMTWRADYSLMLHENESKADLGAWVTVLNVSGASYPNAQLKLIAGDIQRIKGDDDNSRSYGLFGDGESSYTFKEKPFFEYHLYTLPGRVDIDQNATQQLQLFPTVRDIKVNKKLVYSGLTEIYLRGWRDSNDEPIADRNLGNKANKKVDVYFELENIEANNLGIPLPQGKVRAYMMDMPDHPTQARGSQEFIGEDLIDHTAKNQTVSVKFGQSFDVSGNRTQTNYTIDAEAKILTETIKITLKNAKEIPQQVLIRENLFRWANWEITQKSEAYEKSDAQYIQFPVAVPAGGEKEVTYTVRYSW